MTNIEVKVEVKAEGTPEEVEASVDDVINRFESFIVSRSGSAPLMRIERAILKTFLIYAIREQF